MNYLSKRSLFLLIFILAFSTIYLGKSEAGFRATVNTGSTEEGVPETVEWESDDYNESSTTPQVHVPSRAYDYKEAFDILYSQGPDTKIFLIANGMSIDNIVGMKVMGNGTMIAIEIRTRHGVKTRILKAEEISEIGQR